MASNRFESFVGSAEKFQWSASFFRANKIRDAFYSVTLECSTANDRERIATFFVSTEEQVRALAGNVRIDKR